MHYPSLKDWQIACARADDKTRGEMIIDLGRHLHTVAHTTEEPAPKVLPPPDETTKFVTTKEWAKLVATAPDTKAKRALFDSLEAGSIRIGLPPQ